MKCISELYNTHRGEDIYVIGTGASLRVFPPSFFEGKITLGLNMAWKSIPIRYGITIHAELNIPEFLEGQAPRPEIIWATKYEKTKGNVSAEQLEYAERHFYFFETDGQPNTQKPPLVSDAGRITSWLEKPTANKLYLYGSIAGTGVNLAANMGAKNIILVGCDNCALGNNHHSHQQHTRWLGAPPAHRYGEYFEALSEVRLHLRKRGVNVLSMNPFMGLYSPEDDFARLCQELDQPALLQGKDISPPASTRIGRTGQATKNLARRALSIARGRKGA
jgi:hypothetical protein